MERIPTLQVRLTQYEASITYEQMLARKFKVNSGTYRSKDRYQWLIQDVEATEVDVLLSGGETSAALVTYTLSHLPLNEGWKKALALIDYKHLVSGKFVPHLSGDPRTASQTFVDATGAKKADQSVPDYIEFEPQGELDFSTFLQA
ncbi:hypothetical protein [Stieleria mannarensis]|uniref:hypothetical protein n=1 Tax=Stieleria mannarensis TaxID=2755585 RepID=UPI0016019DE0|nr:hypothetical protein [Rhodopirellula sp. JC639]